MGIFGRDAASFGVHVEGSKELVATLDALDAKTRNKIVKDVQRRLMKPVLAKTRELVPVAIEDAAPHDARVGLGSRELQDVAKGFRIDHRVGIQEQDPIAGGQGRAPVASDRKSQVAIHRQEPHLGEFLGQLLHGAIAGIVVHDDDLEPRRVFHLGAQAFQAQSQLVPHLVRDDHDGKRPVGAFGQCLPNRKRSTRNKASRMIPPDILLTPANRSTNTMGTSARRNPFFQTL